MPWSWDGHFKMIRTFVVFLVYFTVCGDCVPAQPASATWGSWGNWQGCNATCNNETGVETRTRQCVISQQTIGGGNSCVGDRIQTRVCVRDTPCTPVDGGWSEWTEWRNCSTSWNNENVTRYRTCTNPAPQHGGDTCNGTSEESMVCDTNITCVALNGSWSEGGEWQNCSASCDTGNVTQYWTCTNLRQQHEEETYNATGEEFNVTFPVNGGWSDWSSWSACSVTCGQGGQMTRARSCDNPVPMHGGQNCTGDDQEETQCSPSLPPCLVVWWSEWGAWTPCSAQPCTEGQRGLRVRQRSCVGGTSAQCSQLPGLFLERQACDSDMSGCS